MTGKRVLIALTTVVALGVAGASTAQASDNSSGDYHGGFKTGPLGQRFGARSPAFGFAYVPHWRRYEHHHRYEY